MKNMLMFLFVLPLLISCGEKNNEPEIPELKYNYINTFESSIYWGCQDLRIQKGPAHSGSYSCVLDSLNPFSTTFFSTIENLGSTTKPFTKIKATAWIKIKNLSANVSFGVQVITVDKATNQPKVIYLGEDYVKREPTSLGKWNQLIVEKDMPMNLLPTDVVKVFAYNATKETVYVDDINIKFEVKQ